MSRIGKKPITIPKGVEVKIEKNKVSAKGPKGTHELPLDPEVKLTQEGDKLLVEYKEGEESDAWHGFYRAMINNLILGVTEGFEKRLSLIGVGFRAAVQGQQLDLQVGYSHPTKVDIPTNLKVDVQKSTLIVVSGVDKQLVGQFAATVRDVRPPEPYKGKGIRYENEYVRKKAGKSAKSK